MADVAVVGAGLMGHALALVFALGGHTVRLTDNNPETLARAPNLMATALATLTENGEVDASRDRQWLSAAVRCVPTLADTVKGASVVIEAVLERPDVKTVLYDQLQSLMEPDAILASNTSNLDIRALVHAAVSVRPRRSLPWTGHETGRGRDRARHGQGDGQGAGCVQADGARLRRQPPPGGDAVGGVSAAR